MENNFQHEEMSYIKVLDNKIIDVGNTFLSLTKFEKPELMNMDIGYIFCNRLRLNINISGNEPPQGSFFIFTKDLEAREVEITWQVTEKIKIIAVNEIPNSRLEEKLQYLHVLGLMEKTGIAVYSAPDRRLIKANRTFMNFFDEPFNKKENSLGKLIEEIIPYFEGSSSESTWRNLLSGLEAFSEDEIMFEGFDRGTTYWNVSIIPIYQDGKVKYYVENTMDITEKVLNRKRIEEQNKLITEQNERFQAIIDNMSDSLIVFDKDKDLIVNKAAKDKLGLHDPERMKLFFERSIKIYDKDGNEIPADEIPSKRVKRGEKLNGYEMSFSFPEDKKVYLNVSGTPVYNKDGKFLFGVLCTRDLTEQVMANMKEMQQKKQLEAIVSNMSDALFLINGDGSYVRINDAARTISAFYEDFNNSHTTKFYDLNGKLIEVEDMPVNLVKSGQRVIDKVMYIKSNDAEKYIVVSGTPILDDKNNFIMGIVVIRDISTRVKYEKVLREKQESLLTAERMEKEALTNALKMKDEFLAIMSHEFKTPITVINTATQTINGLYGNQLSDNVKKHINSITKNSYRLIKLVNNMLDITRYRDGHIQIVNQALDIVLYTREIIMCIRPLAERKSVNLEFSSDIESKVVSIDEEKYERILLNLLSNAIKYTPSDKSVYVHTAFKGNHIVLTVRDEGIGIPKERFEYVFERFGQIDSSLTRRAEGTGIGLSLVKTIVAALDGTIMLKSEVGFGSTFKVTLPFTKSKEVSIEESKCEFSHISHLVAIECSDIYT